MTQVERIQSKIPCVDGFREIVPGEPLRIIRDRTRDVYPTFIRWVDAERIEVQTRAGRMIEYFVWFVTK